MIIYHRFGEFYPRYAAAIGVIKTPVGKEEVVVAGGEIYCYGRMNHCDNCNGNGYTITDTVEIYSVEKRKWKSGMSHWGHGVILRWYGRFRKVLKVVRPLPVKGWEICQQGNRKSWHLGHFWSLDVFREAKFKYLTVYQVRRSWHIYCQV
jgi:hypothetical protein